MSWTTYAKEWRQKPPQPHILRVSLFMCCCCFCLFSVLSFNNFCSPLFRYILLRECLYIQLIRAEKLQMLDRYIHIFAIYKANEANGNNGMLNRASKQNIIHTRPFASTWSCTELASYSENTHECSCLEGNTQINMRPRAHIACIMSWNLIGTTNISHCVDLFNF